jgi:hypothetical protein
MHRSTWSLALSTLGIGLALFTGCGGDESKKQLSDGCVQNSDCSGSLLCSFGHCHEQCAATKDCPSGARCVKVAEDENVCQLPSEEGCEYNSDCSESLVCALDGECRNECKKDRDCVSGQVCTTSKVCAEPSEVGADNDLLGAGGAGAQGGASGAGNGPESPSGGKRGQGDAGGAGTAEAGTDGTAGGPAVTGKGGDSGATDRTHSSGSAGAPKETGGNSAAGNDAGGTTSAGDIGGSSGAPGSGGKSTEIGGTTGNGGSEDAGGAADGGYAGGWSGLSGQGGDSTGIGGAFEGGAGGNASSTGGTTNTGGAAGTGGALGGAGGVAGSGEPTSGLVAYYPFNGDARDESGNGNDGTVYGATPATDRFGHASSAYSFDGTSDYIDCGNKPSLNIVAALTISAWVYTDQTDDNSDHAIVAKTNLDVPEVQYHLMYHYFTGTWRERVYDTNGEIGLTYYDPSTGFVDNLSDTKIPLGRWVHIAGTYDGAKTKIFVDSVLDKEYDAAIPQLNSNSVSMSIGGHSAGSIREYLKGSLDDLRIYNRALSPEEIDSLYHEGGWPDR